MPSVYRRTSGGLVMANEIAKERRSVEDGVGIASPQFPRPSIKGRRHPHWDRRSRPAGSRCGISPAAAASSASGDSMRFGSATLRGRITVNSLPLPSSLSSVTSPPSSRQSSRTIDKPSPLPEHLASSRCRRRGRSSPGGIFEHFVTLLRRSLMPTPVSATLSRKSSRRSRRAET